MCLERASPSVAEQFAQWLSEFFGPEVVVVILSALPISEVRGGIPYGLLTGLPLWKTLLLAIPANVIAVIPMILGFNWAAERLADKPLLGGIIAHLLKKARRKEEMVNKYGVWAVTLFVAVPLPVTGAWTGSVVAAVFGMEFWRAVGCMLVGVIIASTIVTILTLGGMEAANAISQVP
jgi:uncharacterized membrane protein